MRAVYLLLSVVTAVGLCGCQSASSASGRNPDAGRNLAKLTPDKPSPSKSAIQYKFTVDGKAQTKLNKEFYLYLPQFKKCFGRFLRVAQDKRFQIVSQWQLASSGEIKSVTVNSIKPNDSGLRNCFIQVFRRVKLSPRPMDIQGVLQLEAMPPGESRERAGWGPTYILNWGSSSPKILQ